MKVALVAAAAILVTCVGAVAILVQFAGVRARMTNSPTYSRLAELPVLRSVLPRPLLSKRLVTGILVTGTPTKPVIYVTSSDPRISGGEDPGRILPSDTNSGIVSKLTWTASGWRKIDLVRGLPRSKHDHATNGLALDPKSGVLYVAQGANTNEGAPSSSFGNLPEYALSGAILSIDLRTIANRTYDLPTLDDDSRSGRHDAHDPFGGDRGKNQALLVPAGPVQLYAVGFRNPYDLVLTRNGRLYTVDNGSNRDWGGRPRNCANAPVEGGKGDIDALQFVGAKGHYGGHPNPTRGNGQIKFDDDGQRPLRRSDPRECVYRSAANAEGAMATFPTSTNGLAEYRASNFGRRLAGDLLAANWAGLIYRIKMEDGGRHSRFNRILFPNGGVMSLDLTALDDDGIFPGTIWVADYAGNAILSFEPRDYDRQWIWQRVRGTGLRRQEVSFVSVGQKLYLAGGSRVQQVYSPKTNTWRRVAPLPEKLDHIQGVALNGRIYYVGGLRNWPGPAVTSVYIYDPRTDTFSRGAPMPRGRGAGGVAVHDGKIYYAGGLHNGRAVSWFDAYDPKNDSWLQLPDMPRRRDHFQAAVVGNRFFAIGGRDRDVGETTRANDAYDFRTRSWRTGLAPVPTARGGFATAVVGRKVLVIGGEGTDKAFDTVEAYDTVRDSWRTLPPMPTARHGIEAATCGGAVYIAGGGLAPYGGEPTAINEVLFPPGQRGCGAPPRAESAQGGAVTARDFRRSVLRGTSSEQPTSLQFGPDGRLYVAQQDGLIKVYSLTRRGAGDYAVTATETITLIRSIPNHDDDGRPAVRFIP